MTNTIDKLKCEKEALNGFTPSPYSTPPLSAHFRLDAGSFQPIVSA